MEQKPILVERFTDNGEYSHWVLVNDKGQEIASSEQHTTSDAIKFAEWITKEQWGRISKHDGLVYWCKPDNYHYTVTTKELFQTFKKCKTK